MLNWIVESTLHALLFGWTLGLLTGWMGYKVTHYRRDV